MPPGKLSVVGMGNGAMVVPSVATCAIQFWRTNTPSGMTRWKCTFRLSAPPKRCTNVIATVRGASAPARRATRRWWAKIVRNAMSRLQVIAGEQKARPARQRVG